MTVGVCTTAASCVKGTTSACRIRLVKPQSPAWWLIPTSTSHFQPPARMPRPKARRRHSLGSGVLPYLRSGLQNRVDSCNGCRVSSIDERMYKRARGTDMAGKRLPKQTTPKCTLPDEGWWATLYAEIIPFEQRLEVGRVLRHIEYLWPCARGHGLRQLGGAILLQQRVQHAGYPHTHITPTERPSLCL